MFYGYSMYASVCGDCIDGLLFTLAAVVLAAALVQTVAVGRHNNQMKTCICRSLFICSPLS